MTNFKFFIKIVLPLTLPSLSISFFIVLTYLFASFETPYILGITYPKVLAVCVFDMYSNGGLDLHGKIMSLNILISIISLIFGLLIYIAIKFFSKS